ncbi:SCAN domain-containing protein 3 [Eumeta japonica]|uniref:SCAN domain-containing protein 3 n=1 Tax=Eumeta variegata TaxID=151549 RepID=A0A4C1Y4E3_EUMVA|nr:SCAN domain-containing protein 3 [Eumeta japonica]
MVLYFKPTSLVWRRSGAASDCDYTCSLKNGYNASRLVVVAPAAVPSATLVQTCKLIRLVADKRLLTCLSCNKILSNDSMKPSKLKDHLRRCHPDKIGKHLKYFQTLKKKYEKRPTVHNMFSSTSESNDDGLRASYNVSLLITKSGKPHTIREQLILPAVEEILKTVLHKSSFDILKRTPLSNNIVQRRIDEMSSDFESFLCDYLRTTHFSIRLDESTLPGNAVLLLAYVRFVMGEKIHEELLFAKTLKTDTKDGVPAMVGRYRGFISHLKRIVPEVIGIHSVIHRQHLVAKNLSDRMRQSLQLVINAVNKIKSNALNTRLFAQLFEENDEDFQRLLLHTEVECLDEDIQTYVQDLVALHDDFKFRFEDILPMEIPPWIINPFGETEVENVILQEELLELSTNEELKVTFKRGYQKFWLQEEIPEKYPGLDQVILAPPSCELQDLLIKINGSVKKKVTTINVSQIKSRCLERNEKMTECDIRIGGEESNKRAPFPVDCRGPGWRVWLRRRAVTLIKIFRESAGHVSDVRPRPPPATRRPPSADRRGFFSEKHQYNEIEIDFTQQAKYRSFGPGGVRGLAPIRPEPGRRGRPRLFCRIPINS